MQGVLADYDERKGVFSQVWVKNCWRIVKGARKNKGWQKRLRLGSWVKIGVYK
jgi:hypothetical protein